LDNIAFVLTRFCQSRHYLLSLVSALSINAEVLPKVVIVVDETIASSEDVFAVRARTNEATVFLSGKDIYAYLEGLKERNQTNNIHSVNFAALATEGPATSAPSVTATTATKIEAKIEDAHQLAIGVRKDVDFSSWYTNVGPLLDAFVRSNPDGWQNFRSSSNQI